MSTYLPGEFSITVVTRDDPAAFAPDENGDLRFRGVKLSTVIEQLGGSLRGTWEWPHRDGTSEAFDVDLSHLAAADPDETYVIVRVTRRPADLPETCEPAGEP